MAVKCPACGEESPDGHAFCRNCGEPLTDASEAPSAPLICGDCGAEIPNPLAQFCPRCGAAVKARTRPQFPSQQIVLVASGIVAAVALVSVGVFYIALGGRDDVDDTPNDFAGADPVPLLDDAVATIALAMKSMPTPSGETDREQMRSLLGPPEAFTISLEVDDEGVSTRREEWFYYDLRSVYEFVDGALVSNLPIEANNALLFLPVQYDPDQFELSVDWDNVAAILGGGGGLESLQLEPEYGLDATVYAGEQLLLAFDEDGLLFYVEAVPLAPGEPE